MSVLHANYSLSYMAVATQKRTMRTPTRFELEATLLAVLLAAALFQGAFGGVIALMMAVR